jgi:hypothetical protein
MRRESCQAGASHAGRYACALALIEHIKTALELQRSLRAAQPSGRPMVCTDVVLYGVLYGPGFLPTAILCQSACMHECERCAARAHFLDQTARKPKVRLETMALMKPVQLKVRSLADATATPVCAVAAAAAAQLKHMPPHAVHTPSRSLCKPPQPLGGAELQASLRPLDCAQGCLLRTTRPPWCETTLQSRRGSPST